MKKTERRHTLDALAKGPDNDSAIAFVKQKFPQKTAANLAAETGIPEQTIKNWLYKKTGMGTPLMLALMDLYGPEFMQALLPVESVWLNQLAKIKRYNDLSKRISEMQDEMETLKTEINAYEGDPFLAFPDRDPLLIAALRSRNDR